MAEVKILIKGYLSTDEGSNGRTCPTICLVQDDDITMITDPGTVDDQQVIIDCLVKHGLGISDITHVFITHSHIDHYRNIGMFPKAKTVEYYGIWDGGFVSDRPENLTENIRIIETPGHSFDGLTALVETSNGIVAICGDVFWKENRPQTDKYANDMEQLKKSREKVLEAADYVIPGHGDIYN